LAIKSKLENQNPLIEVEKKYRLTKEQRQTVLERLLEIGAKLKATEFEENTLYAGAGLDPGRSALRLRRIGGRANLTYKERFATTSEIKHQQEYETEVSDPQALDGILRSLGFTPTLIYEKRRMRWELGPAEIVVDELPFGLFMEIEDSEAGIHDVEQKLAITDLKAEGSTYPTLTLEHGKRVGDVVEARFDKED
jgi:adenylate cyclase class 2